MKRSLTTLLKAGVSVALLAFFLSRVDIIHFFRVLSAAQFYYIAAAMLIYLFGQLISSLRWALLARTLGFRNPYRDFAAIYFIGMFFSLFTPSTVGGDVGRVFYLARDGANDKGGKAGPVASATVSVLVDRAVGMAVLIWIGAIVVAAFPVYDLGPAIRYVTFAIAAGFVVGFFSLPILSRLLEGRDNRILRALHLAVENYRHHWRALVQAMALSLIVHALQSWIHVLLGRSLGIEIPWSYAFIVYPLVGTFSALPVSLNGIGLREGGYLFLLRHIGVGSERAIAFGLLWFIVVVLDSLIGGMIFVVKKTPKPSAIASEAKSYTRK